MPLGRPRIAPEIRFMKYVIPEPNSGCWLWLGAIVRGKRGYDRGSFILHTNGRRSSLAHKAAYLMFRGTVPDGKLVCHKCDVSLCVNPDHLYVGTHATNAQDMVDRRRGFFQREPEKCEQALLSGRQFNIGHTRVTGEKNPKAKLTEDDIRHIRLSTMKGVDIAEKYGVHKDTISGIRTKKFWRHVQ